jgi:hypothetical protein
VAHRGFSTQKTGQSPINCALDGLVLNLAFRDVFLPQSVLADRWLTAQVRDTPESGRGLPHSKTLARFSARCFFRKVLECGSPLPFSCRLSRAGNRYLHAILTSLIFPV